MRKWINIGKPRYTQYEHIPEPIFTEYRALLSKVKPPFRTPKVRSLAWKQAWKKLTTNNK